MSRMQSLIEEAVDWPSIVEQENSYRKKMIIVNKRVDDAGCISKMVFNSNGKGNAAT